MSYSNGLRVIHPNAKIGKNVQIGPFTVIEEDVVIGDNCHIGSNVHIFNGARIGENCHIFNGASVSVTPQTKITLDESTTLEVGNGTVIREFCTLNRGNKKFGGKTVIGENCLLMAYVHVAHDCIIGNNVVFSNNVTFAGHCRVDDYVVMSGYSGATQFVHIGAHAFVGGLTKVEKHLIPYGAAVGNPAELSGLNLVGLKRRGFDRDAIHNLRTAYRMIFASEGTLRERVEDAAAIFPKDELVQDVVKFIVEAKDMPLTLPRHGHSDL